MKLVHFSVVALAIATSAAHAQTSSVFSAIQSAKSALSAANQPQSPQDAHQQMLQQQHDQQVEYMKRHPACSTNCPPDPEDERRAEAQQKRAREQAQRQADDAAKVRALCPDLDNDKFNVAEKFIRCRNKGFTEQQAFGTIQGLPTQPQAYLAAMIQDIYEDNITDPKKGKAILDYYGRCFERGTTCARPAW
ncbi:hypothetical protein SAMN04487926_101486 [Paraburkholderia steynii]|uniref:Uncharacterized protein n=1 Tax=Paraburkholderia steynii TaxID=1245441 RepID=A0A7Z7B293_9BURK|nr:hypothetical protein [Paraburkholderia steynii]SDG97737.1 hypothetical protein SAMN04487926_101486 [Paraburkholderia steynii]